MIYPDALETITGPSSQPITRLEAASFARISKRISDEQGAVIDGLIAEAVAHAETITDRQIMTATFDAKYGAFPTDNARTEVGAGRGHLALLLPRSPVQSVSSVSYVDADGATQTLVADTDYVVLTSDIRTTLEPAYGKNWPTARTQSHAVTVRFVAGYASADVVPQAFKDYVKTVVAYRFDNRHMAPLPSHARILDSVSAQVFV